MTAEQLVEAFPDNDAAELLFVTRRWPNGVVCPLCSCEDVQEGTAHPQMPFRCRACDRFFSVRTGTVMQRIQDRLPRLADRYAPGANTRSS